jgi:hypothetical protein
MDLVELQAKARNGTFMNSLPYAHNNREVREAYRQESVRIEAKFEKMFGEAILEEIGLKRETDITREAAAKNAAIDAILKKVFNLCWEAGHANGFTEVVSEALDIVSVVKAAVELGKVVGW